MSDAQWVFLGAISGGFIAVVGSAVTQIVLFWMNERRERKERRRMFLEYRARQMTKLWDKTGDESISEDKIFAEIEKSSGLSDDRISVIIGMLKYYVEDVD